MFYQIAMNSIHCRGMSFFRTDMTSESESEAIEIPEHEDGIAIIPGRDHRIVSRINLRSTEIPSTGFR